MGKLLEVEQLCVNFEGVAALSDVSLDVDQGEVRGLVGPNGAGKTTLLNTLSRLVRPARGRLAFDGTNLLGVRPHRIVSLGMARTFQNLALFTSMTVLDNVLVGLHAARRATLLGEMWRSRRAREGEQAFRRSGEEALRLLDLERLAGHRVADLAYGHQKLVELARAVVARPALLLLDEPAAGLNSEEKDDLVQRIRTIRDTTECAILLVEHDMEMVRRLCGRITVLNFGRKIAEGTPEQALAHPDVVGAYLGGMHARA